MTEYEKMLSGELFNPADKSFFWMPLKNEIHQRAFNRCPLWLQGKKERILKRWLGSIDGKSYCIFSPLTMVFGKNVFIGKNICVNTGVYINDYAQVHIGDNVLIGPNVKIVTVKHPINPEERSVRKVPHSIISGSRGNFERAYPIHIGNNVWLASAVTVCPGVTIGDNTVIGAGSVVTKDIPANVFACGVPCRVVKEIGNM